jgi:glutathione S-transferase
MLKLYFAPGACSLADLIALLEVGAQFEAEAVDIKKKITATGIDYLTINPKGYVPALLLDDCEILTENIAVLDWISDRYPQIRRNGALSRTRQLEMLAYISTEIHGAFKPMWHGGSEEEKTKAREKIPQLLSYAAKQMQGDYLFGADLTVSDCYLYVMLRWSDKLGLEIPDPLLKLQWRMEQRPAVQAALAREEAAMQRKTSSEPIDAEVRENAPQHRFERLIHDTTIAAAYYRNAEGRLVFIHTEVPTEFSGQGIATALARGTFDLLRRTGRKAELICPFMVHFANTHPEYGDVVAR